jgi:hypothetical protein
VQVTEAVYGEDPSTWIGGFRRAGNP